MFPFRFGHFHTLKCISQTFGQLVCQSVPVPNLCVLQENMRKRLQYAMPRVPLKNLKDIHDGDREGDTTDPSVAPESNVGKMAKRIHQKDRKRFGAPKRKRVPLGGDIEHEDSGSDAVEGNNNAVEGAAGGTDKTGIPQSDIFNAQGQSFVTGDPSLNIDEEEIEMMKRLEARLRRKNVGKNVKLVAVHDNKEGNKVDDDLKMKEHEKELGQVKATKASSGAEFDVKAMVYGEQLNATVENNGAKNKATDFGLKGNGMKVSGGARPKEFTGGIRRNQNKKDKRRQKRHKKLQKKSEGRNQNRAQVRGGLQDSSETESDGGWDMNGGDIPLLPR